MRLAAAGCVLAAILLARPPAAWVVRQRLGRRPGPAMVPTALLDRLRTPVALIVPVFVALTFADGLAHLIVALTMIGVVVVALRLRRHGLRERRTQLLGHEVAEAVDALAAELNSGVLAARALKHLAAEAPVLAPAAAASRLGADVATALRVAAARPGASHLAELAAAWEVSERSGAPLARVLDRLADGMRDERELRREITAGLGPARATARLMAVLPFFALSLGAGIGSQPVHVLLHTVPGSVCLATGAALAAAGLCWVEAIAARAARA